MSTSKKCARCGGDMATGTLMTGVDTAKILIAGEPDGFLGVIPYTTSQVGARVCKKCGAIDLYAKDVRNLLRVDENADDL